MTRRFGYIALVAAFVAFRAALLVSSYDANTNWEEPVFLFGALELADVGVTHVLEYQDDLNHGGSVVLLLLAVPWIQVMGTSLLALKGLAILWSTLTLMAFVAVGWRHWSPRVGLWLGVCFAVASPTFARLNITLVGSHPESLLPVALALDAYLGWARARREGQPESPWTAFALGLWSGVAMWISYVSTMFIAPLLVLRAAARGGRGRLDLVGLGWIVGVMPWLVQNLWLRPHGAGMWRTHVTSDGPPGWIADAGRILTELAESYGWEAPAGAWILAVCGIALLSLTVSLVRGKDPETRDRRWELLPFAAAPYVGFLMLLAARISPSPGEGYYYARFYVSVQVALFWVLVLVAERWTRSMNDAIVAVLVLVLTVGAVAAQAPLLGRGASYAANIEVDRSKGCMVFGVAEADRARDWPTAAARLGGLRGERCRDRAFGGLGWGMAVRFLADQDASAAGEALRSIADVRRRYAACGGFNFILHNARSRPSSEALARVKAVLRTTCERPSR